MLPEWSGRLTSLYWRLRATRSWDTAEKRRWYRKIAVEKKRLLSEGVPYIEVHLVTRYLTNLKNKNAQARLENYYRQGRLFG